MTRVRSVLLPIAALLAASLVAGSMDDSRAQSRRERLETAQQRLHELEREFQIVVERYNLITERLEDIRAEIRTAKRNVDRIGRRMNVRQEAADAAATELYMGGKSSALEAVLGSETVAEAETRLFYLQTSEDSQLQAFEALGIARAELDRRIGKLEDARARARAAEDRLDSLRVEIEAKVADQKDEIDRLNREIEAAQRRRAARERAERRAARVAERRAERDAARQSRRERAGSTRASRAAERPAPAANASAGAIAVEAALSQLGKPYVWGAEGPNGYDCSGLTSWAWRRAGVSLPHNSGMQYATTTRVDRGDWQPGDLLFFGSPIHHVGMYIGNGRMVEAPYTGSVVRINSAIRSDYVGAGRPGI